jgi:citrate lyase subunit beta/citryl-CoA lyase
VLGAAALAGASPRLAGLAWDAEALAADLGIALDRSGAWPAPLAQARGQVVLAARVAGVPAFETVRRDSASLAGTAEAARLDGFAGIAVRDPAEAALVAAQPPL